MANLINRQMGNYTQQPIQQMQGQSLVNNPVIQQIKQMMNTLRSVQNPQEILQQVALQNPQMAQIMQMCQGKNPKDVFYQMCNQRGINPDDILNALRT